MRKSLFVLGVLLLPALVRAAGPMVQFTLPAEGATPAVFGSLPFPNDLYFDGGRPENGDGTLLNAAASIGLAPNVIATNTASVENGLDLLDGFGTTTAVYFFFSGPLDPLPATQYLTPSLTDPIFCADAATATPVPILVKADIDTRVPDVLAVLPAPGRPLAPKARYVCVVRSALTGGGQPIEASADWVAVRDGASASPNADAIHDPVVATLVGAGVPAASIAGMTVFTTQSTTADILTIRSTVLPGLPAPSADFTSRPELVFDTPAELFALLGRNPTGVAKIATGYYGAARFQTHDPNGDGPVGDLPLPPGFVTCPIACETTDERFTRDGSGTPIVIDTAQIPFTVVVPSGTPPPGGWPVIIQQHGLGGQRDTVVGFAEAGAQRGFASIGIDAAAHGYRLFDCKPAASCSQDTANNFGGTAVPDGFIDGTFVGFDVGFLAVNLGFFQAFHNFLGIRDNFRQTYVDLMSLVRLLESHSIDGGLGTTLDATRIFYMGHSLGGLMGAGFVPIEPNLRATLLNAAGGGLTTQLFLNSSIGAGAQGLVQGILGLDPANLFDQFALQPNLTQTIIDPADGVNAASLLLDPALGAPRNVILVEDWGDQVVPNQANEALAVAGNLPLFDPFVQNLHQNPFALPIANSATPKTVSGNAAAGQATAVLLQNGPATHAASIGTTPGTLTFVPEFARVDEFPLTGQAFPTLERGIRVPNVGILSEVLDWFDDIAQNGGPGTFTLLDDPNYNPIQNQQVPAGASSQAFFTRTVNDGGALSYSEPTPDVVVDFTSNVVSTRLTAGRTTLGATPLANDRDVPPGPAITVGTPGVLPFFVTLQRLVPGLFTANLTVGYTLAELGAAGIAPGSAGEQALFLARFQPGTCTVGGASCSENGDCGVNGPCVGAQYTTLLDSVVDAGARTITATGISSFSTFALMSLPGLAVFEPGAGAKTSDCRAAWRIVNPNAPAPTPQSRAKALQFCSDGDATCDADGVVNGSCTFRVAICFNRPDAGLPACPAAGSVVEYDVRAPMPSASNPTDAANAQALVGALTGLGGTVINARGNQLEFAPPIVGETCTAFARLVVPTGSSKTFRGTTRARPPRQRDNDRLKLRCDP
jgi:hypothetical protein